MGLDVIRDTTGLPFVYTLDSDPTITGVAVNPLQVGQLLIRTDIPSLYKWSGPLSTDWVYIGNGPDLDYPMIRIYDVGTPGRPTPLTAGCSFGWAFAIGDVAYFEEPFVYKRNVNSNIIVGIGWAPTGAEVGKLVSWRVNTLPCKVGTDLTQAGTPHDIVDEVVSPIAAIYQHSSFAFQELDPTYDEVHFSISRIASSNDPVNPPAFHHAIVIQLTY